jgi:uncharacterized membrane protein
MLKKILLSVFTILFFVFPFFLQAAENDEWILDNTHYEKSEVIKIEERFEEELKHDVDNAAGEVVILGYQEVTVKILNGELSGQEVSFENTISNNPLDIQVKQGDRIILQIDKFLDGHYSYSIMDYYRVPVLIFMFILFVLFLLVIGGRLGLKTLFALLISISLIFYILIPGVLKGYNPLLLATGVSIISTFLTLGLIGGKTKKTISAILGTFSGIAIAVILTMIFTKWANINGLCTEDSRVFFTNHNFINPVSLFLAGILIGTLGAVMDAAMSVASAVAAIKKSKPDANFNELANVGLTVGRDIMGTMANTLILAYVSVSLPLLLLYYDFGGSFFSFINFDFVADEIIRSLAGSMGLIASIPITAFVSAYFESKKNKE